MFVCYKRLAKKLAETESTLLRRPDTIPKGNEVQTQERSRLVI